MTIGLEDADGSRGPDPMRVEKNHYLSHGFLFGPAQHDLRGPPRTNALNLGQALRMGLNDIEGRLTKGCDDPLCHGGTYSAH